MDIAGRVADDLRAADGRRGLDSMSLVDILHVANNQASLSKPVSFNRIAAYSMSPKTTRTSMLQVSWLISRITSLVVRIAPFPTFGKVNKAQS
jgi:hypothetical protein